LGYGNPVEIQDKGALSGVALSGAEVQMPAAFKGLRVQRFKSSEAGH